MKMFLSELVAAVSFGRRNFGLDLARALAITMVLVSHGRALLPEFPQKYILSFGGFLGVELFFVLSGFLIGTILLKTVSERNSVTPSLVRDFWVKRWFRTVPNYLLFLFLNATVFAWIFGLKDFDFKYLFFIQNLAWPHPALMPEAWSLAVEEWFYLLLPLVVLFLSWIALKKECLVFVASLLFVTFFTVFRFFHVFENNPDWDVWVRKVVVYRLDSVGYGVLVASLCFHFSSFIEKARLWMFLLGCVVIILLLSWYAPWDVYYKIFSFSLANIGFALMLPWFRGISCSSKKIALVVAQISVFSYSMYLVHFSFVIPFLVKFLSGSLAWYLLVPIYFLMTFFISAFIYVYFEHPMTNLRERFFSRREKTSVGVAPTN